MGQNNYIPNKNETEHLQINKYETKHLQNKKPWGQNIYIPNKNEIEHLQIKQEWDKTCSDQTGMLKTYYAINMYLNDTISTN